MDKEIDKVSRKQLMKKVMRPLRYVWIAIIVFFILFIAAYILLRIPSVQNYIAKRTTEILSNRLHTKVALDRVDIDLFKGVELEKIYIEDLSGDTLVYAGSLYSDFYNSVSSFYSKDFNIEALNLKDCVVKLKRTTADPRFNVQQLFNQKYDPYANDQSSIGGAPDSTKSVRKSFVDLNLRSINLENLRFISEDPLEGMNHYAKVERLTAMIDTFDIDQLLFHLNNLTITQADYFIEQSLPDTLDRPLLVINNKKETPDFMVRMETFHIIDSKFEFIDTDNAVRSSYTSQVFNPDHFIVTEFNTTGKNIQFYDPYYAEGSIESFDLKSGRFGIQEFSADRFYVGQRKSGLEDFVIKTGKSIMKDNISFSYRKLPDWREFVDKVIMNAEVNATTFAFTDLMYFAPKLNENRFFTENQTEKIILSALVSGRVNSLNARELNAIITNNFEFEGSIIGRDLTEPDESLLNISAERLRTNITTLNKLIPGFSVPANFYKLNNISFSGRFDGYYQDFVAYGDLTTDLGIADVDMRLNLKEGSRNASYSGKLNLFDFDLKTWAGNSDFDKLSLSANVQNGRGLELSTAYAELGGEIVAFDYKGYNYNGIIDAKIEQNLFDGSFKINDKNITFDFLGNIDFQKEIPLYDFNASIETLNLQALNLSKDITDIKGILDIKLKGSSIDNLIGSALGNKISIVRNQDTLDFGHLALASTLSVEDKRSIFIDSDIGNAEITGNYKITELPDAVIALLKKNYPKFSKNINQIGQLPQDQVKANFTIKLNDAGDLLSFFSSEEASLEMLDATGIIDYEANDFNIKIRTPELAFSKYKVKDFELDFDLNETQSTFIANIDTSFIDNVTLENLVLNGYLETDTIHFDIEVAEVLDSINNVAVIADFFPHEDNFQLDFTQLNFDLLDDTWSLKKDNSATIGKEYIKLRNFVISDENRSIKLSAINKNKGLKAELEDLQLSLLNRFIDNEDFILSGNVDAELSFEEVFKMEGLFIKGEVDDFKVKDKNMGTIKIDVATDLKTKTMAYDALIKNYAEEIELNGTFDINTKLIAADLHVEEFSLNFLEIFLAGNIENTQGKVFGDMKVSGQIRDLETSGKGYVLDGFTRVNYLGTEYAFEDANFKIKKNFIDFTGGKLIDERGQQAVLSGGLTHKNFNDLGLDLDISSEKFILLNTDEEINPSYYGLGQGKADVNFEGEFSNMKITIVATTGEETNMTLPVESVNASRDESFIPIITRAKYIQEMEDEGTKSDQNYDVGLTLDMFLTVTSDAEMRILFDPVTGHQLQGRGTGDIQLFLTPNGDINMYGGYSVTDGQYDFALESYIKKEFTIREGGTVTWAGDPLDAKINIEADYRTIRAPLNIFLAEYLGDNEDLISRASQETDVKLTVKLLDKLLNPTIKFDIAFPNLAAEISSLVNNKLAILQDDQLILNNQVLGLLIFNNFLPYNNPISSFDNTNINSSFGVIFSELVSAQVSAYVSSLMESVLSENGLLYDVDVDVRLDNATSTILSSENSAQYGVTLKPKFNSDKFDIILGGDYLINQSSNNQTPYTTGDFIFDYYLTEDKKIKIRVYGRTDKQVFEGRRQQVGAGLYFRREFASFKDLRKSFSRVAKEIKEEQKVNE